MKLNEPAFRRLFETHFKSDIKLCSKALAADVDYINRLLTGESDEIDSTFYTNLIQYLNNKDMKYEGYIVCCGVI